MKRAVFLLILILISFCSCAKNETISYAQTPFEATVSVSIKGSEISAKIKYSSPQDIALSIIEPENISGLTFTSQNVAQSDLEISPSSTLNLTGNKNAVSDLFSVLESIGGETFELEKDKTQSVSTTYQFGTYSAEIDCANQRINSIKTKNYDYIFTY